MERLKSQAKELGKDLSININKIRHQYKESECGMYSIHFIIHMLESGDFETISSNKIDDDIMLNNEKLFYGRRRIYVSLINYNKI